MINNKAELYEFLDYEKNLYGVTSGFFGEIKYICKFLCGSERGTIWHWQRRLRITEYYRNAG